MTTMRVQLYVTLFVLIGAVSFSDATVSFTNPPILWSESFGRWTKLKGFIGWNDQPTIQSQTNSFKYAYTRPINKASNWSIAYSHHSNNLYWLDQLEPSKVYKQAANHSFDWSRGDKPLVVDLTNQNVHINQFVVDWTTDNLYVTDPRKKTIVVVGKGDTTKRIVTMTGEPTSLCIHASTGLLFWSEGINNNIHTITRSNTIGDSLTTLVTRTTAITGMCLWKNSQNILMLLWIESSSGSIMSCDVDGGGVREMYQYDNNQASYKAAAVFKNHIFLTNEQSLSIDVISISKRTLIQSFEVDALPYDIIADVSNDQSDDRHECDSLRCEHLCVNVGGRKGRCLCKEGYYLALDGLACEASDSLFIYTTKTAINSAHPSTQLPIKQPTNMTVSVTPLKSDNANYTSLGYHYGSRNVFYSKNSGGSIYRFSVENNVTSSGIKSGANDNNGIKGNHVLEVTAQIGKLTGLTVHWQSGLVMWMDGEGGYIMMSMLDGRYHAIVRLNLKQPFGLAVDSYNGLIFWSQMSKGYRKICYGFIKGKPDEYQCVAEVKDNDIQDMVYDPRLNRLYWSCSKSKRISSFHMFTGTLSHYHLPSHDVHRFTVFQDIFILAQKGNQPLLFAKTSTNNNNNNNNNINTNNYYVDVLRNIAFSSARGYPRMGLDGVNDVIPYNNYLQPAFPIGSCSKQNNCEHLCISNTPQCMCAMGYREEKNKCLSEILTKPALYFIDVFHKQIYQLSLSKTKIFHSSSSSPPSSPSPLPSSSHPPSPSPSSPLSHLHSYPHPIFNNPTQFLTHPHTNVLYVLDGSTVKAYNHENKKITIVYPKNPNEKSQIAISRISLDATSNRIFMTSSSSGRIYVVDVGEGGGGVKGWMGGLNQPYALHVSETSKYLYWSEQGTLKVSRSLSKPTNISTIKISTNITSIFEYSCKEDDKKSGDSGDNSGDNSGGNSGGNTNIDKEYCGYVYISDNTKIYRVDVSKYDYAVDRANINENNNRVKRSNGGVDMFQDVSRSNGNIKDAKINSLTIHDGFLYFSATNKRTVYRISLKDPSSSLESFPLPLFARIGEVKVVYYNPKSQNTSIAAIVGTVLGLLLLLLLLLLCCLLFFLCRKRKRRNMKENSILATASIATSATTLPINTGKYGYEGDNDLLGEVMYEHLFHTNDEVEGGMKGNKNNEVSELTLNVEILKNTNALFHHTSPKLNILQSHAGSDVIVDRSRGTMRAKKPAKVNASIIPTAPSTLLLNGFAPTSLRAMNKAADSRPLPSASPLIPPPISSPPPYSLPPVPPSYLKESTKKATDQTNAINSTPGSQPYLVKPGFTLMTSPPKLHTQARGFAPASHATPQPVKSTWGRNKYINK